MESQQLPLFPLNTVLFPGTPLPLHIFEERYRRMIRECVDREAPFGVVLIKSGREVGGPAEPRDVGTSAVIAALSRLDDGRMNLIAIGQQRFRIHEVVAVQPYLIGQVSPLADDPPEPDVPELTAALIPVLTAYLDALFVMLDQPREPFTLPSEPERLSYVAAAVMQIGLEEKQRLLELTRTGERLRSELDCLRREHEKLAAVLRLKKRMGAVTPFDSAARRDFISPN